jgi:predicted ATPase/DNA-binding SARP family transcriptional activator
MESTARLFLLGTFRLEKEGYVVSLATRKVASLLAYLALHPKPHPRETIATLFWGDSSDEHARRSLRTALATLRKQVGPESLLTGRETVQFNPRQAFWVDAIAFQAHAKEFLAANDSMMVVNTDMYQGPLLAGFDDEWIPPERERLRALYLEVLLHLTQRFRTQGEYPRAIETARRVLATDAANERAQQQIMSCYLAVGDREGALKQYAECRSALRAELAVEPSPETEALFQRIKHITARRPSLESANTNLPIPLTSFIGRTRELALLKELLITTRLLTLTGVGGCGKTRLAIQMATDVIGQFSDGVWWVELAGVSDASLLPHVVRKVLGLSETPGIAVPDLLISHLRSKRLLLVLDNCEHLVAACAQLAETILSHCPDVQILATSREMLGISGEVARLVPSLSLPIEDVTLSSEALLQWEGIRLFVERAMAAHREFAVTPENMGAIARVCRQVDGMPLAIELAAARIRTLSVEQIAARLDDCFHLLTLGSRTALPRQQTLRMTMDWSHDLLSQPERIVLRRLSVFAGGFTLEAAEAVCAGDEVQSAQMLDLLTRLVDKSLVVTEYLAADTRYRLLETIRQYAGEKLIEAGEKGSIRDQHLRFFLRLAEVAERKLQGRNQVEWLNRLDRERANLRAALGWSNRESDNAAGLRLAASMWRFWFMRGEFGEGRRWLEETLARIDASLRTTERAYALTALGCLIWMQGRQPNAVARALFESSAAIYQELGDTRGIAYSLLWRSHLATELPDSHLARSLAEESVRLFRTTGDRWGLAQSLFTLGRAERVAGDHAVSLPHYEESVAIFREVGDRWGIGLALSHLGWLAFYRADYVLASSLFKERLTIGRELGFKQFIGMALDSLGRVAYRTGDYGQARTLFEEGLLVHQEMGSMVGIRESLRGLSELVGMQGQPQRAVHLLAAAEALSDAVGAPFLARRTDSERAVAALRAQLDEATFSLAWAEGRAMTLEQAIAEALAC